ncbi:MAG: PH domain-containing protein, partial [Gemmatimonadota bacterium]
GQLALAGATSNEAGLIAAGLATALELAGDLGGLDQVDLWLEETFERGASVGLLGAVAVGAGLVLGIVLVGWLLSVVVTVIRYHGFTLTRAGDELKREYGLFSRHHSTVPLERVQAVRIEESLLRRLLGLAALKIETAGGAVQQQGQARGGEAEAFVPIARRRDVGPLLREVFPDARLEGVAMHSVSPIARRRSFLRLAVPVAVAAVLLGLLVGPRWYALLLLWLPSWLYARADYRARAWARPPSYVLVRGGVFTRVSWVVPERKIQTLHVGESPFQRRLDLATLMVDTAAGARAARVADLERGTARPLLLSLARDAEAARRTSIRPAPPAPG